MKSKIQRGLLLITIVMSLTVSCNFTSAPPTRPPDTGPWPTVLECGPSIPDVLAQVSTILQTTERPGDEARQLEIEPSAVAELERLAVEQGKDTVACLVDLLFREWTRLGASENPERFAAAQRAHNFLDVRKVEVRSNKAFIP